MVNIELRPELEQLVRNVMSDTIPIPRLKQETLLKYQPREEFKRDWTQYESHCRREKLMFLKILKYAIDYINIQEQYKGNGRPNAAMRDIVKALCIRVFSNFSSWRCESELKMCRSMGFIDNIYRRSTMNKYLQSEHMTRLLKQLILLIAEPLAPIELHYSADASGIGQAYGAKRWVEVRDQPRQWRYYRKIHIISGAKTNVIVAVKITEGKKHEAPFLPELLAEAKERFHIKEFSADAGYLSRKNVKAVAKAGALPFIKPKKNVAILSKNITSMWGQMLKLWKTNQDLFAQYYNQRQNVEATFSMLKRKFGGFCRSKCQISQKNEILAKVLCHNAVILTRGMVDFNLDVKFMATL